MVEAQDVVQVSVAVPKDLVEGREAEIEAFVENMLNLALDVFVAKENMRMERELLEGTGLGQPVGIYSAPEGRSR